MCIRDSNIPAIVSTVKGVWKSIKGAVNLTWKVIRVVGRTMSAFGKFVLNLFNRGKADENVKGISENNAELQAASSEVEEMLGPLDEEDLSMGEEEEGSEESETEGGDEEATDKPAEVKPATTSTTPPSAEKANEAGTGDQLVKDKPLPKEETKAKKEQKVQETKSRTAPVITDPKIKAAIQESMSLTATSLNLKKVIPKQKDPVIKAEWEAKLKAITERQKVLTKIIAGEVVDEEVVAESGAKTKAKVTSIPKTTDIKSLGTEELVNQLTGNQTVTTVFVPIVEKKVEKVPVPVGGGSVVDFGSSSTPVKTNLNLKKSVI